MKGNTAAILVTVLVATLLTQLLLVLVRNSLISIKFLWIITESFCLYWIAEAPRITTHPQELKDTVPGQLVTFTVHATGTEPISYLWLWKPAGDVQERSEGWQLCDKEWSRGNSLKIPSVQKLNEGSYQCVVSNCAGSQISEPGILSVGKYPISTTLCTVLWFRVGIRCGRLA